MNELINEIRQGDTDKYRLLVRQLAPSLRSYLAGRLSDFHLVEDLSQEIFIAVFQSLEKFDPKYDFRTWFFTIARNKLNSHLRKTYSKKNLKFAFEEEIQNLVAEVCDDDPQREQKLKHIQSCIAKLPEEAMELIDREHFPSIFALEFGMSLPTGVPNYIGRKKVFYRQCLVFPFLHDFDWLLTV